MIKTLAELCTPYISNIRQKDLKESGSYPCYGAAGIAGYRDVFDADESYVGVIKDGAGVGRTNVYPPKSSLLGTMQYLKPNDEVDAKYLMYLIRSLKLGTTFQGSTIPHIYFKDYKKTVVKDRSLNEQMVVSDNLSRIEEEIDLSHRKLELLDSLVKSRFMERRARV